MKFLIIQTAFIGDVILATPVIEKLHQFYPEAKIDFILRKGNEDLFKNHPYLNELIIWDKRKNKFTNLIRIIRTVRRKKYHCVINLHRFASSGIVTILSGATHKIGFNKNPFSILFTKIVKHEINTVKGGSKHETKRNLELINDLGSAVNDHIFTKPKLYPSKEDFNKVSQYKEQVGSRLPIAIGTAVSKEPHQPFPKNRDKLTINHQPSFICIAPVSVWFTKQFPKGKWIE